jgi:hypothetical protein
MNSRFLAVFAALLAPLAVAAQDQAGQAPAQSTAPAASSQPGDAPGADVSAVEGKVDALGEQVAELKTDVAGLKKLKFSGYVQGRWAWQEAAVYEPACADPNACTAAEIKAYAPPDRENFFIRRGRFKAVYYADWSLFVLQTDVTPAGVSIKEGYAELKLPKGFAIDTGLQLFPFGYEVAVRSSADLDLLERAMITQTLLKGEYDLGVALRGAYGPLNFKIGLFNGNGIDAKTGGRDNDQLKDVIGRVGFDLGTVTGGVSGWYGKTIDYTTGANRRYDRVRVGADLQVFLDLLPFGGTAVKGEYIWGKTAIGDKDGGAGDRFGKTMSGWYALVTQNVGATDQVAIRYDWFIPDHGIDQSLAANASKVFVNTDLTVAVHHYVGAAWKLTVLYDHPMNGDKGPSAPSDPKKDAWIAQAQVKF